MTGPHADSDDDETMLTSLRKVLGDEDALVLIDHLGGVRIKIPSVARATSSLAKVVGLPVLERLVRRFKGTVINVPIARRFRVLVMRQQGKSYSQIAARLCMTERTVYGYISDISRSERRATLLKSIADGRDLTRGRKLP